MGGLGMLGNPAMFQMQSLGMATAMPGGVGRGLGVGPDCGRRFVHHAAGHGDEDTGRGIDGRRAVSPNHSLAEAVENAAKAVTKGLEKK